MHIKKITKNVLKLLEDRLYFSDSIIKKITIENCDGVSDNGGIQMSKSGSEIEMTIVHESSEAYKIQLSHVSGVKLLDISNFIIDKVALKEEGGSLLFSLTGGFGEDDIYFRAKEININNSSGKEVSYSIQNPFATRGLEKSINDKDGSNHSHSWNKES